MVIPDKFPWTAVSPDGLIKHDDGGMTLLEIKCIFSFKDSKIGDLPFLDKDGKLKKSHTYYTQIQLGMHLCNCEDAILFLYTLKDQKVINVKRDTQFV